MGGKVKPKGHNVGQDKSDFTEQADLLEQNWDMDMFPTAEDFGAALSPTPQN